MLHTRPLPSRSGDLRSAWERWPIPSAGWRVRERHYDTVRVDGIEVHRAALEACDDAGRSATGAAASSGRDARARAYFELAERIGILEAAGSKSSFVARASTTGEKGGTIAFEEVFPASGASEWQFSRSSGVALGRTLEDACARARAELVERDACLRSWYGGAPPRRLLDPLPPRTQSYDWWVGELDAAAWARDLCVVVAFAFPEHERLPLLRGFAARKTRGQATRHAFDECLQSLAFISAEEIPSRPPPVAANPIAHLDYFLYPPHHKRVRAWLEGKRARAERPAGQPGPLQFAELSEPTSEFRIVKALRAEALRLHFGEGPLDVGSDSRLHPFA